MIFTKDEIIALKRLAKEDMEDNERMHGEKHYVHKPNVFPKGYKGPRSYAEAMARNLEEDKEDVRKEMEESANRIKEIRKEAEKNWRKMRP